MLELLVPNTGCARSVDCSVNFERLERHCSCPVLVHNFRIFKKSKQDETCIEFHVV